MLVVPLRTRKVTSRQEQRARATPPLLAQTPGFLKLSSSSKGRPPSLPGSAVSPGRWRHLRARADVSSLSGEQKVQRVANLYRTLALNLTLRLKRFTPQKKTSLKCSTSNFQSTKSKTNPNPNPNPNLNPDALGDVPGTWDGSLNPNSPKTTQHLNPLAGPDLVPPSQKRWVWPQCMEAALPTGAQTSSPGVVGPCQAQAGCRQRGILLPPATQNASSPCSLPPHHWSDRPMGCVLVSSCALSSLAPSVPSLSFPRGPPGATFSELSRVFASKQASGFVCFMKQRDLFGAPGREAKMSKIPRGLCNALGSSLLRALATLQGQDFHRLPSASDSGTQPADTVPKDSRSRLARCLQLLPAAL